jgi:hypothetical protein
MAEHRYQVVAIVGSHEIKSPNYESEEEALRDLNTIRDAQKGNTYTELPWLSVNGEDIVAAHVDRKMKRGPLVA